MLNSHAGSFISTAILILT